MPPKPSLLTLLRFFLLSRKPPLFLSNTVFRTDTTTVFPGEIVEIQSIKGKQEYAIDVIPATGGRLNKFSLIDSKKYSPPAYDERIPLTADSLRYVLPGMSLYDLSMKNEDKVKLEAMRLVNELYYKIYRAKELLCSNLLFFGIITLINGDTIDFKFQSSHIYSTPTAWTNSTADPFEDLAHIAEIVQNDSGRLPADIISGTTALQKFLNNDNVKKAAQFTKVERLSIESPIAKEEGAVYHGTLTAGSYKLNVWTYPFHVRVPDGYDLPNEGELVPVIPADRMCLIPANPDFFMYYAANPVLKDISVELAENFGLDRLPALEMGKFTLGTFVDEVGESIIFKLKCRPLPAPADPDQIGVLVVT